MKNKLRGKTRKATYNCSECPTPHDRCKAMREFGWNPHEIGTHWPDCHKSHPACAFIKGWNAAEKSLTPGSEKQ